MSSHDGDVPGGSGGPIVAYEKQKAALRWMADLEAATVADIAAAAGMSENEARASLKGLAHRGYVFEHLGDSGSMDYVITENGRWVSRDPVRGWPEPPPDRVDG